MRRRQHDRNQWNEIVICNLLMRWWILNSLHMNRSICSTHHFHISRKITYPTQKFYPWFPYIKKTHLPHPHRRTQRHNDNYKSVKLTLLAIIFPYPPCISSWLSLLLNRSRKIFREIFLGLVICSIIPRFVAVIAVVELLIIPKRRRSSRKNLLGILGLSELMMIIFMRRRDDTGHNNTTASHLQCSSKAWISIFFTKIKTKPIFGENVGVKAED